MKETKITSKFQTTVPKKVRELLDIKAGEEIGWNIIKGMVIVDKYKKMRNPTKFLTSQIKLYIDAVDLVRKVREEIL